MGPRRRRFSPATLTAILSAFAHVGHEDRDFVVVACSWMAQPYRLVSRTPLPSLSLAVSATAAPSSRPVVRLTGRKHWPKRCHALLADSPALAALGSACAPDPRRLAVLAVGAMRRPRCAGCAGQGHASAEPQYVQCAPLHTFVCAQAELDTGTLAQAGWVMAMLAGQGVVVVEEEEEVQNFITALARQAQRKVSGSRASACSWGCALPSTCAP